MVLSIAMINMSGDTSLADFSFQVLITWGINVMQDNIPAAVPMISTFMVKRIELSFSGFYSAVTKLTTISLPFG